MPHRSLTEIANQYCTDKGTVGPSDQRVVHNYTDIYAAYFEAVRNQPLRILEIGLGVLGDRWPSAMVSDRNSGGASMKTWYDYFPHARIFGIDINACPYLDNDRIKTFVADQSDVAQLDAFMEAAGGDLDIIIDDGSHRPHHQQITLNYFFRRLRPGGRYFIEDLSANGMGSKAKDPRARSVRDTRSVLKHFQRHGTFQEPNALFDPEYLRLNIDYLVFHSPKPSVRLQLRPSLQRPIRKRVYYKSDAEKLCMIRKKISAP